MSDSQFLDSAADDLCTAIELIGPGTAAFDRIDVSNSVALNYSAVCLAGLAHVYLRNSTLADNARCPAFPAPG